MGGSGHGPGPLASAASASSRSSSAPASDARGMIPLTTSFRFEVTFATPVLVYRMRRLRFYCDGCAIRLWGAPSVRSPQKPSGWSFCRIGSPLQFTRLDSASRGDEGSSKQRNLRQWIPAPLGFCWKQLHQPGNHAVPDDPLVHARPSPSGSVRHLAGAGFDIIAQRSHSLAHRTRNLRI